MLTNTVPLLTKQYSLARAIQTFFVLLFISFVSVGLPNPYAFAQGTPRLNSLFPAGGQPGTTVEIAIQGADLDDPHEVIIEGESGITAELHPAGGEVDNTHKPVFEANCGQCHELRSPSNRSMTPAQWKA
ncbi:hypothetical protein F4Y93_02480, partial [Candidatus Poribacteria bacterium]|nr:hypothetical protein [Candidatus Poribacteria bacterium]